VPQNWSGSFREQKLSCVCRESNPLSSSPLPSHCMLEPVRLEVTCFVQDVRYCCFFWVVWYLVSLRSTYQQHLICFENFILICFENVITIVSGLLSCLFISLYSIPNQKRIEIWERPLFLKTLQYEV